MMTEGLLFDAQFLAGLHGLRMRIKRQVLSDRTGESRGIRAGLSGEFADHRMYMPGDDLRHLDWPLYWRQRKPFIKVSDSQEDCPVYIVLDATASMSFGTKWNYARQLAATISFIAIESANSAHLFSLGDGIKKLNTTFDRKSFFKIACNDLQSLQAVERADISAALNKLPFYRRGRGITVLISDFLDCSNLAAGLSCVSANSETVLFHVVDGWEQSPDLQGLHEFEDLESGHRLSVAGPESVRDYRRQFMRFAEDLRCMAHRRGLHYVHARTDEPINRTVMKSLAFSGR
jgi:uncharacterized protein (DUF58 family)